MSTNIMGTYSICYVNWQLADTRGQEYNYHISGNFGVGSKWQTKNVGAIRMEILMLLLMLNFHHVPKDPTFPTLQNVLMYIDKCLKCLQMHLRNHNKYICYTYFKRMNAGTFIVQCNTISTILHDYSSTLVLSNTDALSSIGYLEALRVNHLCLLINTYI